MWVSAPAGGEPLRGPRGDQRLRRRRIIRQNLLRVLTLVLQLGGEIRDEVPQNSGDPYTVLDPQWSDQLRRVDLDGCAFGLLDPDSGLPVQRRCRL